MEQDQTGSEEGLMTRQAGNIALSNDGLSLQQLENMLSDIRFQPIWRDAAAKSDDYYDGHQLTVERLDRMERLGIPPLITNLIAPAINAVLGMEAKTRTDWRVTQQNEVQDVPEEMMDAMNAKLNEAERECRADRAISDAYAPQVKSGMGWVEVSRSVDAFAYPYRVSSVHRDEMWWDWRAGQPDLSDARYVIRKRTFDQDVLMALMPEHADLIKWSIEDRFRTWQFDTHLNIDTNLAMAAHIERITNIDSLEWRNADRKRATLYEVWYRMWKRGLVLKLPDKRVIPFRQNDPRHVQAVQSGLIEPKMATFSDVRVAFYMGCHRLYDMPSPYAHRHFPYVPFWGYREYTSGVPYGLIRAMMSPQDVVNSSDSKMHWMLNSRRLRADSDAIDARFNSWENVRENLARTDSVVLLDPTKPNSRFREENDTGLNQQQFQRRMQAAQDIDSAGGVYKSTRGQESNAVSGLAKSTDIEQGNIVMAEINDNYAFARRQVGELLFSMVREDLLNEETPVMVKKGGSKKKLVVLNQRQQDGSVLNDVSSAPAKVVLEDVPSTPAFRAQQLQTMAEITKSLPPEFQAAVVDVVIGLTDIPQKERVLERIRKAAGIQEDLTPEEEAAMQETAAKAQQAQQLAVERMQNAEIALAEAKALQMAMLVEKGNSERLVKMVEAMYAAIQAGQIIATVPGVAPVADELLKGAGYVEQAGGQDMNIPSSPAAQPIEQPAAVPDQSAPMPDQAMPAQEAGMMQGIETQQNDGMQINQQEVAP
ncbi:MAG: hypothetical protein A2143_00725 [Gallionellales bacterium RBG_16_57_15]|nr:MAG: hypothetical protein A2143_00725 [Gallionellales bacterium RBG_16_57_15]